MMITRILFAFIFMVIGYSDLSATKIKVYLFSGLGSDERIFEKIKLDTSYQLISIIYPIPPKNCEMKKYAELLIPQIDTSADYILIGVSIGGMICSELADLLHPKKVILISSAKCRKELPLRYRFQKTIPINKLAPKGLMKISAKLLQPLVEPDRNKNKETFKSMLASKNKTYLKRSVNMIINWNKKTYNEKILHIHGTNDHTLPFKKVKATHIIDNGSHMMALTRGEEINSLILILLKN